MKVESPEIDSINKSTKHISNWLHNDFREILKPLQVLPSIPPLIQDFKSRLSEQFRMHFSGQVAVQMKAREANIRVAQQKALLVDKHIDRRTKQLEERTDQLTERSAAFANQLAQEHTSFLKQLDSHIYDITDQLYPDQIQNRFTFDAGPFWNELTNHNVESTVARSVCLLEGYDDARKVIEPLAAQRRNCYQELRGQATNLLAEAGLYELPFWYAIIEDTETGEQHKELIFGWDLGEETGLTTSQRTELERVALQQAESASPEPLGEEDRISLAENLQVNHGVPTEDSQRFASDCLNLFIK